MGAPPDHLARRVLFPQRFHIPDAAQRPRRSHHSITQKFQRPARMAREIVMLAAIADRIRSKSYELPLSRDYVRHWGLSRDWFGYFSTDDTGNLDGHL